jgi:hypothetical protein
MNTVGGSVYTCSAVSSIRQREKTIYLDNHSSDIDPLTRVLEHRAIESDRSSPNLTIFGPSTGEEIQYPNDIA